MREGEKEREREREWADGSVSGDRKVGSNLGVGLSGCVYCVPGY